MRSRLLPAGGVNLFQGIKAKCREAEASKEVVPPVYRTTRRAGAADARKAAAESSDGAQESMHEYQG